jgi:hypothetical protein
LCGENHAAQAEQKHEGRIQPGGRFWAAWPWSGRISRA